jgi:HSP20 family protein
MSWFPRRRRDRRDPFDWLLDEEWPFGRNLWREHEDGFRQMREEMNRMIEKARKGELDSPENGGPYVYGWSMRVGPDGVPHVEEFGNTKTIPTTFNKGLPSGREPLVDVIQTDENVKVIAELPGVEKEDVDLEIGENRLVIKVDTEKRKYYKDVKLPATVDSEKITAKYNNGVLEVVLDKKAPETKGKKIQID